jgi:hypothetical protein
MDAPRHVTDLLTHLFAILDFRNRIQCLGFKSRDLISTEAAKVGIHLKLELKFPFLLSLLDFFAALERPEAAPTTYSFALSLRIAEQLRL